MMRFPAHALLPAARALLLAAGLIVVPLIVAPLALGDDQARYEAQMRELQRTIQNLQQELRKVQGERGELEKALESSETEIGDLLKRIQRIQQEIEQQNSQLRQLNRERDSLQVARRTQQQQVANQVRAAYQMGSQSQLKLLLNQESPERVTRLLRYHDYLLASRSEKINDYLDTIASLDALEPRIQQQAAQLAANRSQLNQRHQQLSQRQEERQRTLVRLNSTIQNKDQELRQQQQDRERLQTLLDEMASVIASIPLPGDGESFGSRRGKLPWPTQGRIVHRFGSARVAGQLQWNGVLIDAPEGQPVVAVHHGRVIFADYFRGHGLLVILDHGDGYMSLYAHNQSLFRQTGDWVSAGDVIASVGDSGGQARTGLYFEIRRAGKPTDPAPWLSRA